MANSNTRLVYSTDPKENQKCPRCKELLANCTCLPIESNTENIKAKLRIEKSGRSGKTVTVIEGLPKVEAYLKELTSELKKRCGSGGTFFIGEKSGIIEIQGDKQALIIQVLKKRNINC